MKLFFYTVAIVSKKYTNLNIVDKDLSSEGFLCDNEDCCGEPRTIVSGAALSSVSQCFSAETKLFILKIYYTPDVAEFSKNLL